MEIPIDWFKSRRAKLTQKNSHRKISMQELASKILKKTNGVGVGETSPAVSRFWGRNSQTFIDYKAQK